MGHLAMIVYHSVYIMIFMILNCISLYYIIGSAQTNGKASIDHDYGGVVFGYNQTMVRLWAPTGPDGK